MYVARLDIEPDTSSAGNGQWSNAPNYTPGIYAAGYIVFALTFVRSSVRMFVRSCVCSFVTFRHVRRIYLKVFG